MNQKAMIVVLVLAAVLTVLSSSVYIINESQVGVKLKFGEVIGDELKPGLGFKIPVVHEIRKFDARIQPTFLQQEEYFTKGKKLLSVDSYIMWEVRDVKRFYTATSGDVMRASNLIEPRVNEQLRNAFGLRTMEQVITDERDEVLEQVLESVADLIRDELGAQLIDIRVKKIELPPDVSESVYDRMRAERDRDARTYRSEGKQEGERIRADADRTARFTIAGANRESEITRGEGDAIAAKTYAEGYSKDKEFFEFYRSLAAYRQTFSNRSDMILLRPDGEFFNYLKRSTP